MVCGIGRTRKKDIHVIYEVGDKNNPFFIGKATDISPDETLQEFLDSYELYFKGKRFGDKCPVYVNGKRVRDKDQTFEELTIDAGSKKVLVQTKCKRWPWSHRWGGYTPVPGVSSDPAKPRKPVKPKPPYTPVPGVPKQPRHHDARRHAGSTTDNPFQSGFPFTGPHMGSYKMYGY